MIDWDAFADPYRLAAETIGDEEIIAAKAVLDSGYLTMGAQVRAFELEFADWTGASHAVMVNSGSSANLLVAELLVRGTGSADRLQRGDEVIVPALAWPTTVWPLAQMGLVPVFVDVDPETLALDLGSAATMVGPRTRGMFLIHALGRAANLTDYLAFCQEHDLVLLEDCCESLGAHWDGAHVGTAGRAGTFSFYFSHHISTIEGGMVVTDDDGLADDLRGLRAHGWIRDRTDRDRWRERYPELDPRFLFATVGYNLRPTELQAAIGRVQLRRLDGMLSARVRLAGKVADWLTGVPWLSLIGASAVDVGVERRRRQHSWMTLPMRVTAGGPPRNEVMRRLEEAGVETRPIIAGNLARHPAVDQISHRCASNLDVCDAILTETFMVGCHPVASDDVIQTLERALTGLSAGS
jgi:CDP-4-dehydro-6-deoxyglucose reductase, E1